LSRFSKRGRRATFSERAVELACINAALPLAQSRRCGVGDTGKTRVWHQATRRGGRRSRRNAPCSGELCAGAVRGYLPRRRHANGTMGAASGWRMRVTASIE